MPVRTPSFWYQAPGLHARLLQPLGWVYGAITRARLALVRPAPLPVPLVCIGNVTAGGGGKTPLALALLDLLHRDLGDRLPPGSVHFLTRGHGGSLRGPLRVDPTCHGAAEVGDEPLLLAETAPCWVARDRQAGARAACAAGARLIIMDDGLQNPHIARNATLLAVKGKWGFGNGMMVPAGPLREPLATCLARCDAVIVSGSARHDSLLEIPASLPSFSGRLVPDTSDLAALGGRRWLAVAGIADPASFTELLEASGVELLRLHRLADHQIPDAGLIAALEAEAQAAGVGIVTTAKDWVRLPASVRPRWRQLRTRLHLTQERRLLDIVLKRIGWAP